MSKLYIKTPRQTIALITKIFEAMGHLAVVTTIDRRAGILRLLYDQSNEKELLKVLDSLPCELMTEQD